ncbi:MAG: lactate utilization protein [Desulfomonile tiedjei]|nr:lactate utilization protein [Desulfomonile tiedjei]
MTQDAAIDLFVENAEKAGARVVRVSSAHELNEVLSGMLEGATAVYSPGVTPTEKGLAIPPDRSTEDYVNASACVEEVSAAVAETGSLVCSSQGGKPVQAGLLPGHHIAIVAAEHVYEDLDRFFAALGDAPPTNITLETGPSRTADIELTLTIGVHGPDRLSIIVV